MRGSTEGFLREAQLARNVLLDLRRPEGDARRPWSHVVLELTHRCNLRCRICPLWGAHLDETNPTREAIERDRELTVAEWIRVLDEIAAVGVENLVFTGGEIFLRPDVFEILEAAVQKGFHVEVSTNGTRIGAEEADRLVAIGPDLVRFPLEGERERHDRLCRGEAFDAVRAAVSEIAGSRVRRKVERPRLLLESVLQRGNEGEASFLVRFAAGHGVEEVLLSNIFFQERQAARKVRPRHRAIEVDRAWEEIRTARKLARRLGIKFTTPFDSASRVRALTDRRVPIRSRCLAPWVLSRINPYGNVLSCEGSAHSLGNIRTASFASIWNGASYLKFRRSLRRTKLFPDCATCSLLSSPRARWWGWVPAPFKE